MQRFSCYQYIFFTQYQFLSLTRSIWGNIIYQMYFKRMAILLGWLSRIFGGFSGEIVKYLFNIFSFFEINTTLIHSWLFYVTFLHPYIQFSIHQLILVQYRRKASETYIYLHFFYSIACFIHRHGTKSARKIILTTPAVNLITLTLWVLLRKFFGISYGSARETMIL